MNIAKHMEAIFMAATILSLNIVALTPSDYTNIVVSDTTVTAAVANASASAQGHA